MNMLLCSTASENKKPIQILNRLLIWETEGFRTLDPQNHNLML
jgi:hypothetical protein